MNDFMSEETIDGLRKTCDRMLKELVWLTVTKIRDLDPGAYEFTARIRA